MSQTIMIQELKSKMSKYGIQLGETTTVSEDSVFILDSVFEGEPDEVDINNAEYKVVDSNIIKDADNLLITSAVLPEVVSLPIDSTNSQIITAITDYIHAIETKGQQN